MPSLQRQSVDDSSAANEASHDADCLAAAKKAWGKYAKIKTPSPGPLGCRCPTFMAPQGSSCVEIATTKCRSPGDYKKLKRAELSAKRPPHQSRSDLVSSLRLLP